MRVDTASNFKETEYYKPYLARLDEYCCDIVNQILDSNDNEIKYSWNDVLKLVYRFVNTELRDFADSLELNPIEEKVDESVQREILARC
ncbi:MAG: hypothetical protein J6S85_09905 [Methanobrevibacter sp.]|nr:hypothetical protein [Methanobrevibacter sp.]